MGRPPNLEARDRILKAASELFHRRGFKGVSMDDVAGAAELKKANLFHYYPTKEELGAAVIERVCAASCEEIRTRFSNGGDPVRTVEAMFAQSAAQMKKDGCSGGCLIGNLAQELSDESEMLRGKLAGHIRYWVAELGGFLERHKKAGYFRKELAARETAEAIVALLEGATLIAKANRDPGALKNAQKAAAGYLKGFVR